MSKLTLWWTPCNLLITRHTPLSLLSWRWKNYIHSNIVKGECLAFTLLDLPGAFNKINHEILLHKHSICFGISGVVLNWMVHPMPFPTDPVCQSERYSVQGCLFNIWSPTGFDLGTNTLHIIHYTFKRSNPELSRCLTSPLRRLHPSLYKPNPKKC